MPNRTRPSNPKKTKAPPAVSETLKADIIKALVKESGNSPVGVPQLVTKFPRRTGPQFIVSMGFQLDPVQPKINK